MPMEKIEQHITRLRQCNEVLRIAGAITHYEIKGTDYKVLNLIPRILMRSVKIHRGL